MSLLSVIIPTTPERSDYLFRLSQQFVDQLGPIEAHNKLALGDGYRIDEYQYKDVQVIVCTDSGLYSTGQKRNWCLQQAKGKFVCSIDDDDKISDNYFELVLTGCRTNSDCCSMMGIIYEKNSPPRYFEHSLKYAKWDTRTPDPYGFADRLYERYPNHLNAIRTDIAKQFEFPGEFRGEDHMWSNKLHESGLIKSEYYIKDVLYHYTPSDTRK